MATNGTGAMVSRVEDMAAYDRLPPDVRHVVQHAATSVGAQGVEKIIQKYDKAGKVLTIMDRLSDVTRSQTRQIYGEDHPQSEAKRWEPIVAARRTGAVNTRAFDVLARKRRQPARRSLPYALAET